MSWVMWIDWGKSKESYPEQQEKLLAETTAGKSSGLINLNE
jgi:hypothetical protein